MKGKNFNIRRYLTEEEKADLENLSVGIGRERAIKELARLKRKKAQVVDYDSSKSGRVSSSIMTALGFAQSPVGFLNTRSSTVSRASSGRRGRPKGTYDKRYAAYGGVYGYRKQLNARLRMQKLEALRRATINPQQQKVLADIEARERARRTNPENQIIPDTRGDVPLRSIHQEIDDASNIIP